MYRGSLIQQLLNTVERAENAARRSRAESVPGRNEVTENNGLESEEALRGQTTPVAVSSEPG